jgi:exodeoxyribonuclease-5
MSITLSPQQDAAVVNFSKWAKGLPPRVYSHTEYKLSPEGEEIEVPMYTRGFDDAPYFLLEGYAGTGKSTILPHLMEATGLQPEQIHYMSPTGKAAKVMTRKMQEGGGNRFATTIHKAIYNPKMQEAYKIEAELETAQILYKSAVDRGDTTALLELKSKMKQLEKNLDRAYDENAPKFQLDVNSNIKQAHMIIVDECSMVDAKMAADLRSFGVPILAMGDPGQLPPVDESGPGFCNRTADAQLTEIHRQALDNPIIWASMLVREGRPVPYGSHGGGLLTVLDRDDENDPTFDLARDAQIIVGRHERRWQITRKFRKMLGYRSPSPMDGELMMIIKNSRLYGTLVNGTMAFMTHDVDDFRDGRVTYLANIEDEEGMHHTLRCLQATIEEHYLGRGQYTAMKRDVFRAKQDQRVHEMDFAYAITCHKSQGSQWDEVILHDESSVFREAADRWLYTGITRAAKNLTIVM